MKRRQLRKRHHDADINITAFLNLMVVLIPFLLISAVFSQVAVLDLFLPGEQANTEQSAVQARIIIRRQHLEVGDAMQGDLEMIPKRDDHYDFARANQKLQEIKINQPSIRHITILLEDNIDYEFLIQAMDHARYFEKIINGRRINAELFPLISIGSAPLLVTHHDEKGGQQ